MKTSQVPGGPIAYMPCSQTPAGRKRSCHDDLSRCCLPPNSTTSATALDVDIGARSHGLHARCVRFAVRVTPADATLATGLLG